VVKVFPGAEWRAETVDAHRPTAMAWMQRIRLQHEAARPYSARMSPEKAPPELPARSGTNTSEKVVVTFRFPRDLASWLSPPRSAAGR
jgi:hypothetical protein